MLHTLAWIVIHYIHTIRHTLKLITNSFKYILILNIYFETSIIFKNLYFISVYWLKIFCNFSVCLSFIVYLPEDGNMSGRNM